MRENKIKITISPQSIAQAVTGQLMPQQYQLHLWSRETLSLSLSFSSRLSCLSFLNFLRPLSKSLPFCAFSLVLFASNWSKHKVNERVLAQKHKHTAVVKDFARIIDAFLQYNSERASSLYSSSCSFLLALVKFLWAKQESSRKGRKITHSELCITERKKTMEWTKSPLQWRVNLSY